MKVFISTTSFGEYDHSVIDTLKEKGFETGLNPHGRKLKSDELVSLASDVVGLIAGTELIDRNALLKLKSLKVISRCGTGMDNVDLAAAKELGIKVFNTPDAPTKAVAELTLGLILDCLRRISRNDREIRSGKWNKPMGELLSSKTVGIIGYGRIGRAVGNLVKAFGAKVIAYDVAAPDRADGTEMVPFDELIGKADIITLHCPSKDNPLITGETISKMKDGVYIINAARGGIIDEDALYEGLISGKIAGAGIDTYLKEPYKGKLTELDNIILTSHIGSYAKQSRIEMEKQAVNNLLSGLGETK